MNHKPLASLALCLLASLALASNLANAQARQYQSPEEFIQNSFPVKACTKEQLWLDKAARTAIEKILDHRYSKIRLAYCTSGSRSAWVLDEIGKVEAITTGIIVNAGKVETVKVLEFRESRGAEVHRHVFTRQYVDAVLTDKQALDRNINGISGATLSVNALNRQVKLALLLDQLRLQANESKQ